MNEDIDIKIVSIEMIKFDFLWHGWMTKCIIYSTLLKLNMVISVRYKTTYFQMTFHKIIKNLK